MAEVDDKALPGDRPLWGEQLLFLYKWSVRPGGDRYLIRMFAGTEWGRLQLAGSFELTHTEFSVWMMDQGMLAGTRSNLNMPHNTDIEEARD